MLGKLIASLLYACWVAVVIATPLLGIWVASSLVAFHGGPAELALAGGALLFPVLPLAWELRATAVFKREVERKKLIVGKPKQRSFTVLTRLVLRTLFVNLVFLAVLAVWFPAVAFPAVATRGDWFLDGQQGPGIEQLRKDLGSAAGGLEWLYALAHDNPYKKQGDDAPVPDSVRPVPTARHWGPQPPKPNQSEPGTEPPPGTPPSPPQPAQPDGWTVGETQWPWEEGADVRGLDGSSIEALGKSVAAKEQDPFRRVKLLHDWVVTSYRYDSEAVEKHKIPPQDAQSVFGQRVAVCEGYARTLVALGKVTGDNIVYVTGDVREEDGSVAPVGHAWNAVEIKGVWYLIDATWDDPVMEGGGDAYRTDYLFIPPSLAVLDHLPDQSKWQLLAQPLSHTDFLRQPLARPSLAREGLTLVSPERSTVEVDGPLELELKNPRGLYILVMLSPEGGGEERRCGVDNDPALHFTCDLPAKQVTNVRLYRNKEGSGNFGSVAVIRASRR